MKNLLIFSTFGALAYLGFTYFQKKGNMSMQEGKSQAETSGSEAQKIIEKELSNAESLVKEEATGNND
jgi:predicted negative regulator of RcsB-dependent stress response